MERAHADDRLTMNTEKALKLRVAMEEQAELIRRDAATAGDQCHTLERQYLLGLAAGLKRAAAMLQAAGSEKSIRDSHKPAA
jgi:hypothetical protein